MKNLESTAPLLRFTLCVCVLVSVAGCAGQNEGYVLNPATGDLDGSWEYLMTNFYQATFTGCTADAAVLEGVTLYEALPLAPICLTGVVFDAVQVEDSFNVPAHSITCSDGAGAAVTANGAIVDLDISGQWVSSSDQGVDAVQIFTGTIVGNTIELTETRRTFSGSFQGSCDFTPPLTSVISVQ